MSTPNASALYCRISKDARGEGLGVARQEELCRDLANRKGWPVAHVYIDNDLSAYSGAPRPEYERMVEDLEAGTIDAVVVVDQDRLTRHPM
ncbi:MAG TPA: recombinase family protein, partial [Acidimicrobiia bacterium]|nr:recombinase family protein [Acidimicrobiia bacterium]